MLASSFVNVGTRSGVTAAPILVTRPASDWPSVGRPAVRAHRILPSTSPTSARALALSGCCRATIPSVRRARISSVWTASCCQISVTTSQAARAAPCSRLPRRLCRWASPYTCRTMPSRLAAISSQARSSPSESPSKLRRYSSASRLVSEMISEVTLIESPCMTILSIGAHWQPKSVNPAQRWGA